MYVLFYPFIILVWYIPKILFTGRNYFVLIYFVDAIVGIVTKLRIKLFSLLVLCTGIAFINLASDSNLIIAGMIVLTFFLLYFAIDKLLTVFRPLKLFSIDILETTNKFIEKYNSGSKKNNKNQNNTGQRKNDIPKAVRPDKESAFFMNRVLWYFGHLLKIFEERKLYMLYFLLKVAAIIVFTAFLVIEINFGFLRLDSSNFIIAEGYNKILSLIFYSGASLVNQNLTFITVQNEWPQYFKIFAQWYYVTLILTIVGYYRSTLTKRFQEAIQKAKTMVDNEYNRSERYIKARFKQSPEEMYSSLKNIGSSVITFVDNYLSKKRKKKVERDSKGN